MIRKNDYKDYVLMQKTIDNLYPTLPVASGSLGVGLFTQLRGLSLADTEWIRKFDCQLLDTSFCLNYGDRWLNPRGAVGLNFNTTTKVFSDPTFTTISDLAKIIRVEYDSKWQKLYELMAEDYNPLDNWDGTEDHDGDWTKNGTKSTDNTTTFNGGETRTDTYNLSTTDNNTRTLGTTDTTTYNISTTDNNTRTLTNTDTTTFGTTVTDAQTKQGGYVDETLVSGYNSGTSGTHPAEVLTSETAAQTVNATSAGDYVPKQLSKHTTTDGTKTSGKTGTEAVAHTGGIADVGTGGKTGTEAVGSTGTIADVGTGGTTGTLQRGTTYNNRNNVFDGAQTYDLDGTDDKTVTYTGFMDRTGRGTRQALGEQEWEFRKHLFIETVMKDIADYISLKIY